MIQRVPAAVRGFIVTLAVFGLISWQSAPVSYALPKWFGKTLDWHNGAELDLTELHEHSVGQLRVMLAYSPYRYGDATSPEAALVGYVDAFRDYTHAHLNDEIQTVIDRCIAGAAGERDRTYLCTAMLLGEAVTRPLQGDQKDQAWDLIHRWAAQPPAGAPLSYAMLSSVLLRNQYNLEARQVMAACCQANPKLAGAWKVLAFACETGEAKMPAISAHPGLFDPHDPGFDFDGAIKARQQVLKLSPGDEQNRLMLAKDLTTVGQKTAAKGIYKTLATGAKDHLIRTTAQGKLNEP